MIYESMSEKDTFEFGKKVRTKRQLPVRLSVLDGDLGVGKTVFTQGFRKRTWHRRQLLTALHLLLYRIYDEGRSTIVSF